MRKILAVTLTLFFSIWLSGLVLAGGNPYERITEQSQAKDLFVEVRQDLQALLGLSVTNPIDLYLVEPKVLDDLLRSSPYKGAEIGLYRFHNGRHEIYVMKDWSRDLCSGVMAHEFTHAWQHDHCPPDQELVIIEGFARFVEAKYYDKIGAYKMVDQIRQVADPIYGVGYKTMLSWEDKYGAAGVVKIVQQVSKVSDVK